MGIPDSYRCGLLLMCSRYRWPPNSPTGHSKGTHSRTPHHAHFPPAQRGIHQTPHPHLLPSSGPVSPSVLSNSYPAISHSFSSNLFPSLLPPPLSPSLTHLLHHKTFFHLHLFTANISSFYQHLAQSNSRLPLKFITSITASHAESIERHLPIPTLLSTVIKQTTTSTSRNAQRERQDGFY